MAVVAGLMLMGQAQAIHFYRSQAGGCSSASGVLGTASGDTPAATVRMLHNTYHDTATGGPVTRIPAGGTVEWQWTSAHCHSVSGEAFESGFHYPDEAPESPRAVPGLFEYPVPDDTPTLLYRRTFAEPGTYSYSCVHHAAIGMVGRVIVG